MSVGVFALNTGTKVLATGAREKVSASKCSQLARIQRMEG
jgi:hypothetical protein